MSHNHHSLKFQNISIALKENPAHTPFLFPQMLTTINLLSVSMDSSILDISYQWLHIIGDPLRLGAFISKMALRFIHVVE